MRVSASQPQVAVRSASAPHARTGVSNPTASVLALQRAVGNRATCALVRQSQTGVLSRRAGPSTRRPVQRKVRSRQLMRAANDMVAYTGGHRGYILVFDAGSLMYACPAGSGHQESEEWQVNVGPLPTHTYYMHPQRKVPPVTKVEQGTCGAGYVASGYQEIASNDLGWCGAVGEDAASSHYCRFPCMIGDVEGRCFTPQDCWGTQRIRIEGGVSVAIPGTKRYASRGGFFLHAGNRDDPVSSGCLKTFNENVFDWVRQLNGVGGRVPLCVGDACPDWVQAEYGYAPTLSYWLNGPG